MSGNTKKKYSHFALEDSYLFKTHFKIASRKYEYSFKRSFNAYILKILFIVKTKFKYTVIHKYYAEGD